MVDSLWNGGAFNFVIKDAEGLFGRMLIVWDADELEGIFSFSGTDFVGFCAKKINSDDMYFLVNVYSPFNWD